MSKVSAERTNEVASYAQKHGIDMASDYFGMRQSTIERYLRLTRAEVIPKKEDKSPPAPSEDDLAETVLGWLKREDCIGIGEISRRLDKCKDTVMKILERLHGQGVDAELDTITQQVGLRSTPSTDIQSIDLTPYWENQLKILVVSDSHLCSKKQQVSLLNAAYDEGEEQKVDFAVHAGDVVAGSPRMHRGYGKEVFLQDADEQIDYAEEHYPHKPFRTYMLDYGQHDRSWMKESGINVVRRICEQRKLKRGTDELVQRKGDTATFTAGDKIIIRLEHPDGGMSYAKSYNPQKRLAQLMAEVLKHIRNIQKMQEKYPHIVVFGHYHQAFYMPEGGIHAFCAPCFETQTQYLVGKGLFPFVGWWIVTIYFDNQGNIGSIIPRIYAMDHATKEHDY